MKKKPIRFFIVLISILLIISISLLLVYNFLPVKPRGKITLFLHLYNDPLKQELENELSDFIKQNPEIELEYFIEPYLNLKRNRNSYLAVNVLLKNHIVISSLLAGDVHDNEIISPGSWTGMEWNLYYNEKVLAGLGLKDKDIENLMSFDLSDFIEYFSPMLAEGQTLFSVSSKYYIQYLAWLQHLQLENTSGFMPDDFSVEDWSLSINSFTYLVSEGMINPDHREVNEASTAIDMFKGDALFTLFTDNIYSIFLPGDRLFIHSLPFPGSVIQGWHVGSGFYLVSTQPEKPDRHVFAAEQALLAFLRSEDFIADILKSTGIKLNPLHESGALREISSISDRVRDIELKPLLYDIRHR